MIDTKMNYENCMDLQIADITSCLNKKLSIR